MVWQYALSLIEPPLLPINVVYSIVDARKLALQYIPTTKQALGQRGIKLRLLLPKIIKRALYVHKKYIAIYYIVLIAANRLIQQHTQYKLKLSHIVLIHILTIVGLMLRQHYRVLKWSNNFTTNQYCYYPPLKQDPNYKNQQLIQKAYNETVGKYYKKMIYQPMSGYCGYATVNTVIASIAVQQSEEWNSNGILSFHEINYISDITMINIFDKLKQQQLLSHFGIERVENLCGADYTVYLSHVQMFNDPRYRYIAYWHRSPLFFCDNNSLDEKLWHHTTVHWSPIGAYLPSEDLVMILDVNQDYSEFLVSPKRLYDCLDIPDYARGKKMGLIRITLKQ